MVTHMVTRERDRAFDRTLFKPHDQTASLQTRLLSKPIQSHVLNPEMSRILVGTFIPPWVVHERAPSPLPLYLHSIVEFP